MCGTFDKYEKNYKIYMLVTRRTKTTGHRPEELNVWVMTSHKLYINSMFLKMETLIRTYLALDNLPVCYLSMVIPFSSINL